MNVDININKIIDRLAIQIGELVARNAILQIRVEELEKEGGCKDIKSDA